MQTVRFAPVVAVLVSTAALVSTAFAGGKVVIERKDMRPDRAAGVVRIALPAYSDKDPTHSRAPVVGLKDIDTLLLNWFRRGTAAGNRGDLYDNRDRDHSNLRADRFPQLTFVEYADDLKQRGVDYTVNPGILFNRITLGNSSTASKGSMWRSNARRCYTESRLANAALRQYVSNHIYVYPEHRDHDTGHNGPQASSGDVFPTNTPYLVVSQGSSGSDRAFLEAITATLAAFHPKVKAQLAERGLIAPVIQMILRRTYAGARSNDDYLTGAAHPTVFNGDKLNRRLMVEMAHGLTLADVPPLARLAVVEESLGKPGVDYFEPGAMERLMDSPFVVARVHRSARRTYSMVVNARPYPPDPDADANAKVSFRWSLLRGDPRRVRITPLAADGSRARIEVDYHERMPIAPGAALASNRVDIGCFADNGKLLSAPSFVTFYTLDSERRTYDAKGRIVEIAYGAKTDRIEVKDWPKLIRWLAAADADDTRWLTASWSDREHAAVLAAAKEYIRLDDLATAQPDGPTRKRLADNAAASLDRERPLLGGSLRRVIRQSIDLFVLDPQSPALFTPAQLAKHQSAFAHAKATGALVVDGENVRIRTAVDWPDGQTDRLTRAEAERIAHLSATLLTTLAPQGTIAVTRKRNYYDPVLATGRDWRDVYHYAPPEAGVPTPIGFTRHRTGEKPQRFTPQGHRVTELDDQGRPLTAIAVSYKRTGPAHRTKLIQADTEKTFRYTYTSDDDYVGSIAPLSGG